ncbi:MAG: transcription antitermination factor NusB [Bryobacteraceae bacterium]
MTVPNIARRTAFQILTRVEAGAWASELLVAHTQQLEARDAGLAWELVLGSLRRQAQLDFIIGLLAPRKLDVEVRVALRLGLYQLRHLERVPAHAAVTESVELAKAAGKRSAAGLVNAVLRRAPTGEVDWPDRATALSCPAWLLESWERQFGLAAATVIAEAALQPPQTHIASTGRIQDVGAQSIVPLLRIEPGQTFLDVCAAPGNKTAQAIEAGAEAVACDLHLHRLRALADLPCHRVVVDATRPLPFPAGFHRVLVDAPCSGTGTLGRNPEIKWRVQPTDLLDLHRRQVAILRNSLACLAPGGVLVYSTCSLEREENEDVIAEVGGNWSVHRRIPGTGAGDGFFAAVLTSGLPANG